MPFDAATYSRDPLTITEPRERLEYLRDFLRRLPAERFKMASLYTDAKDRDVINDESAKRRFNARTPLHNCNTAACIAGWTITLFAPKTRTRNLASGIARELLGLDLHREDALFTPADFQTQAWTPSQAADVLDHLLKTGEVDWSVASERA